MAAVLSGPGVRDRAIRVGTIVRAERGVEQACEILERQVAHPTA